MPKPTADSPEKKPSKQEDRRARQAAKLRENLRRRKPQATPPAPSSSKDAG